MTAQVGFPGEEAAIRAVGNGPVPGFGASSSIMDEFEDIASGSQGIASGGSSTGGGSHSSAASDKTPVNAIPYRRGDTNKPLLIHGRHVVPPSQNAIRAFTAAANKERVDMDRVHQATDSPLPSLISTRTVPGTTQPFNPDTLNAGLAAIAEQGLGGAVPQMQQGGVPPNVAMMQQGGNPPNVAMMQQGGVPPNMAMHVGQLTPIQGGMTPPGSHVSAPSSAGFPAQTPGIDFEQLVANEMRPAGTPRSATLRGQGTPRPEHLTAGNVQGVPGSMPPAQGMHGWGTQARAPVRGDALGMRPVSNQLPPQYGHLDVRRQRALKLRYLKELDELRKYVNKGIPEMTIKDSFEDIEDALVRASNSSATDDRIQNTKDMIVLFVGAIMLANRFVKAADLTDLVPNIRATLDDPKNSALVYRLSKNAAFGGRWAPETRMAVLLGSVTISTAMNNGGNGWVVQLLNSYIGGGESKASGLAGDMERHGLQTDFNVKKTKETGGGGMGDMMGVLTSAMSMFGLGGGGNDKEDSDEDSSSGPEVEEEGEDGVDDDEDDDVEF